MKCSGVWAGSSTISSARMYPYHRTTYLTLLPLPTWHTMWSTTYSCRPFATFSSSNCLFPCPFLLFLSWNRQFLCFSPGSASPALLGLLSPGPHIRCCVYFLRQTSQSLTSFWLHEIVQSWRMGACYTTRSPGALQWMSSFVVGRDTCTVQYQFSLAHCGCFVVIVFMTARSRFHLFVHFLPHCRLSV